ncbi:TetR/AcrR family transcriptional regulator [Cohnella thermotolerans]|uniref:TetR/AcrR family transcriptional regulator n=1 Tax=Cohnella thermotolerans TaxID=329858 RepID=UPI000424E9E4|nr:TetR family transcriptional regulator [Cohnella thermotolerans]
MAEVLESPNVKASVKERILNAAEEAFACNSFSGTRVGEIAVKAEVNQALIYYYFESKERLYQEVLNRLFAQWEAMLGRQDWQGKDATAFLREYIRAQYEMKCKLPNLYKIFHWESLEGGGLFEKYASPMWTQDFRDIAGKLAAWQDTGALRPQLNAKALLFLMFGMMDQFYYRGDRELASILGGEGSLERLHAEAAEQMIGLTLHGALSRREEPARTPSSASHPEPALTVVRPAADGEAPSEEQRRILETLRDRSEAPLRFVDERSPEQALQADSRLIFVFAATSVGEMPDWLRGWLTELERHPAPAAGRFFGIWTGGNRPAADGLQRLLEDAFNAAGGYAVSRLPGQSPGDYADRCLGVLRSLH